jgi:RNA polymerase sigma-70 factor (ECF subfamily)
MDTEPELSRLIKLEPHSLGWVHDRYYAVVYRYVFFRLGDEQTSEDLTADVFLRLLEALDGGRPPGENLRGWLLGTAAHLVTDSLRRKYARPVEDLDEQQPSTDMLPEAAASESVERWAIRKALQQLTEDQQHVLALRFGDEISLEETARAMGKSVGAVKVLQFRALASLKREVEVRDNL